MEDGEEHPVESTSAICSLTRQSRRTEVLRLKLIGTAGAVLVGLLIVGYGLHSFHH